MMILGWCFFLLVFILYISWTKLLCKLTYCEQPYCLPTYLVNAWPNSRQPINSMSKKSKTSLIDADPVAFLTSNVRKVIYTRWHVFALHKHACAWSPKKEPSKTSQSGHCLHAVSPTLIHPNTALSSQASEFWGSVFEQRPCVYRATDDRAAFFKGLCNFDALVHVSSTAEGRLMRLNNSTQVTIAPTTHTPTHRNGRRHAVGCGCQRSTLCRRHTRDTQRGARCAQCRIAASLS